MALSKFLARELGKPSAIMGRFFLAPTWNKRNAALNNTAFEHLDLQPHDRVLEVGFGGGYLMSRVVKTVTEGMITGIDISPAMVQYCSRRFRRFVQGGRLDLRCSPVESLPFPESHFTKVCTVNSIFYWQDVQSALSEQLRVLVDGGRLVLCMTCKEYLEKRGFSEHGLHLYHAPEIEALLLEVGFRDVHNGRLKDSIREYLCVTAVK
jgi:ubiquinone/menaquinone biosynthesis C-methylase UbiE